MKSGFVAIIGRPNVGKSTIVNAACGHIVSIVTDKAQTTRDVIKGIYNDKDSQIVFVDTPGIHKPFHELGTIMNNSALASIKEVDAVAIVVDSSHHFGAGDRHLIEEININCPIFILINKIDLANINQGLELRKIYQDAYPKAHIIEMSALKKFNIDEFISQLKEILPEGPKYFDDTAFSDHDDVFMMKEVIREQILNKIRQEVPHQCAVIIEQFEKKKDGLIINAAIIVEKQSQKGILIGKGGKMIKSIGSSARKELEQIFKKHIYLDLYVKVKEDWLNNDNSLKEFGYK
jgi:GTP-binding protein Era